MMFLFLTNFWKIWEKKKKKKNTSAFVEAAEIQYIVAKKRLNFQN